MLGYLAGEDLGRALTQFSASQDAFDRWLKQQLLEATGGDMNTPSAAPVSEVLANYDA